MRKIIIRFLEKIIKLLSEKEIEHHWVNLLGEENGQPIETPLKVCSKCGAIKPGHGTVIVAPDYIDMANLTADPTGVEGRMCYRGDLNKGRIYDGVAWRDFPS